MVHRYLTLVPALLTTSSQVVALTAPARKDKLTLLTFDLDDTLYPIAPVIEEANAAFASAMERYGYTGIKPEDIDATTKEVRAQLPPPEAAALSHTSARERSIRQTMESVLLKRKLQETAEDWVTAVEDLSPVVVENAKSWTSRAVSSTIVQAVLTAWEMERHHSAERHVYPEVVDALQQIKEEHPDVVIGAVTDGKANPLFMTFTLAPYFDFCMSWEDDQKGRTKFFQDLSESSSTAELSWIYNAAVEKAQELAEASAAIKAAKNKDGDESRVNSKDGVWIHVGDDLAYDVGGSASCGAKTIFCELADEYKQTARHRYGSEKEQPAWSTAPPFELEARQKMNEAAQEKITETINFIRELPDAINRILTAESSASSSNSSTEAAAAL